MEIVAVLLLSIVKNLRAHETNMEERRRVYGLSLSHSARNDVLLDYHMFPTVHHAATLPSTVDLRPHCPPVYDQGNLGSCTANSLCALMQYLNPHYVGSRLFLYYNERRIEGDIEVDAGATIADGIRALKWYGLCPESEWPYVITNFSVRPPGKCYSDALHDKALRVYSVPTTLLGLKTALIGGHLVAIGISVFESFESQHVATTGEVPLPNKNEKLLGGHAVVIVGYNELQRCFIMRNSWGTHWGQAGYFTIPYDYLTNPKLATDAWAILSISK